MGSERLEGALRAALAELVASGRAKGAEQVIAGVVSAEGGHGPRYLLEGAGDRRFLRMNSNGYLGMTLHPDVQRAEAEAVERFGVGPQAVRFISGTFAPHVALERRLAAFHGREAAMIFSSAYAAVVGILAPLITDETVVLGDQLNHNSIFNAIQLGRPARRVLYRHGQLERLQTGLERAVGEQRRAIVVTDGVFSMRGDHAPLAELRTVVDQFDERFP